MTGAISRPPVTQLRHVVDVRTLEMLVCPLTKTRLSVNSEQTELVSVVARLAFPIRLGVPLLCLDEARPLLPEEIAVLTGRPA